MSLYITASRLKNTTIDDTGSVNLSIGTTEQRPDIASIGDLRFNSTFNRIETYTINSWKINGFPYLYHNEGIKANLFTGSWNNSTTYTMANFGNLGYVTAHGWGGGPSTYTLTLRDLPAHTTIKYSVYWHLVDSHDNETSQLFLMNSTGGETEHLRFTKVWNTAPSISIGSLNSTWVGGLSYTYRPWSTSTGNNSLDGYIRFDSGYFSHSLNTFTARHVMGTDQTAGDEAAYLSHVQVWLGV